MNKIIFTLFVLFGILLNSCTSKNDWHRYMLKGKVKSIEETRYYANLKDDEWEKDDDRRIIQKTIVHFNDKGFYTSYEYYDDSDRLLSKDVPEREKEKIILVKRYDEDENVIGKSKFNIYTSDKQEFTSYDQNGEVIGKGVTEWENNRIIKTDYTIYESGEKKYHLKTKYKRNKKDVIVGYKSHQKSYGEYGDVNSDTYKVEYLEFDNKNNWTKSVEYEKSSDADVGSLVIRKIKYY
jgi:hypothetical protein